MTRRNQFTIFGAKAWSQICRRIRASVCSAHIAHAHALRRLGARFANRFHGLSTTSDRWKPGNAISPGELQPQTLVFKRADRPKYHDRTRAIQRCGYLAGPRISSVTKSGVVEDFEPTITPYGSTSLHPASPVRILCLMPIVRSSRRAPDRQRRRCPGGAQWRWSSIWRKARQPKVH